MRRVAQVLLMTAKGGGEVWMATLYPHLRERADLKWYFVSHNPQPNFLSTYLAAHGEEVTVAPGRFRPLRYVFFFWRFFRRNRIDVVHTHIYLHSALVLLAAWAARVPVRIMHSHSAAGDGGNRRLSVWRVYRFICRALINLFATHILHVSAKALDDVRAPFFRGKCGWLPPSGNLCADQEAGPTGLSGREAAGGGRADRCVRFACVGRMYRSRHAGDAKNQIFLVDVARALRQQRGSRDFHIFIIGDGQYRAQVERRVHDAALDDQFTFTGEVKDVMQFHARHVDALLAPSNHEGFGMAVLEAQLIGLPALVSENIPPEAIINGDLIERVPLADGSSAWAAAMARLCERIAAAAPGERARQRSRSLSNVRGSLYDPACNAQALVSYYY